MLNNVGLVGLVISLVFLIGPFLLSAFFGHRSRAGAAIGNTRNFYIVLVGTLVAFTIVGTMPDQQYDASNFGPTLLTLSLGGSLFLWFIGGGIAKSNQRKWYHSAWMFIPVVGWFYPMISERVSSTSDQDAPDTSEINKRKAYLAEKAKDDPAYKYIS